VIAEARNTLPAPGGLPGLNTYFTARVGNVFHLEPDALAPRRNRYNCVLRNGLKR
jgi:hypothetical protein